MIVVIALLMGVVLLGMCFFQVPLPAFGFSLSMVYLFLGMLVGVMALSLHLYTQY